MACISSLPFFPLVALEDSLDEHFVADLFAHLTLVEITGGCRYEKLFPVLQKRGGTGEQVKGKGKENEKRRRRTHRIVVGRL